MPNIPFEIPYKLKPSHAVKVNYKDPLMKDVAGYWFKNEGHGKTVRDIVNNVNAIRTNDTAWDVRPKTGWYLEYPGDISHFLNAGNPASGIYDVGAGSFTWYVKIRPNAVNDRFISKGGYSNSVAGVVLSLKSDNSIELECSDGSTRLVSVSRGSVPANTGWHDIFAGVQRGVGWFIDIDGVEYTGAYTGTDNFDSSRDLNIGRRDDGNDAFNGGIDTPILWKRALSKSERTEIRNTNVVGIRPRIELISYTAAVGGVTVNIPTGSLGLTGFAPIVSVTNNQVIDVPVASLDLAGLAPTINTDVTVSVPAASLGLIGLEPTIDVTENQIVNVPVASLALSGQVPTITTTANISIDIPVASLGLNGLVPTIATTGNIEINVPVADLTLTGQVPTITVTANISIDIPTASLSLVGQVPVIVTDDNIIIDVPVASLSLVGYGPDAVTPVSIDVPVASLALDGKVPTIQTDVTVNIPVASLALTGEVPTITATANISIDVPVGDLTLTGFIPTILTPGVVPSVPGLEYTLVANRLHFVIPINRLHHTLKENKLHYTVKEEN